MIERTPGRISIVPRGDAFRAECQSIDADDFVDPSVISRRSMTCWHTAPSSRRFSTIWGLARPPEVFLRKNMARNRGGDSFVAHTKSAGARSVRLCGRARSGTGESSSPPRSRLRADRLRDCGGRASRGPCRLSHAAAPTTVCLGRNNPRPASRRRRSRTPRNSASARSAPDRYGNARKSPPMTLRAFFIRASRRRIRNRRWKMVQQF
jgi:hypothetical protein